MFPYNQRAVMKKIKDQECQRNEIQQAHGICCAKSKMDRESMPNSSITAAIQTDHTNFTKRLLKLKLCMHR